MVCYGVLCYVCYATCCIMLRHFMLWYTCVTLCYGMLRYVSLCYFMLRYAVLCYATLCYGIHYIGLCHVVLRSTTLCYVVLRYVTLYNVIVMLCYAILCYAMVFENTVTEACMQSLHAKLVGGTRSVGLISILQCIAFCIRVVNSMLKLL